MASMSENGRGGALISDDFDDGAPGDVEAGDAAPLLPSGERPVASASKSKKMTMNLKKVAMGENPWFLTSTIVSEFLAVLTLGLIIQLARGFYPADPVAGSIGIGGGFMGVYFFFSTLYTPVHLNPMHTVLHMICGNEGILSGMLRIVFQLAGNFAAAGISRPLLDSNYVNTAIKLGSGISDLEGLFVETMGEIFFGLVIIQLALYAGHGVSIPLSSFILGVAIIGFQTIAYPITAASFNMFRWLATNAVGGSTVLYFTEDWWVYLLAPFIALVIVLAIHFFFKWLKDRATEWTVANGSIKAP